MSTAEKQVTLAQDLEVLKPEVAKVLPEHVTPDRFMRVVMTAIAQTPDLRNANRRSLLTSCVRAATDGLVPDGREAALVTFRTKSGPEVIYFPMVAGILKKVRNSGELKSIMSNVVYEQDEFNYWIDDAGEHITHKPNISGDRGKFLAVYGIAKTKDDGVYVEVMSRSQIEQVRNVSRAKDNGPWRDWYDEMARKTVIRRLAKRLPMSTDLEAVIQRDDEMYDLKSGRGSLEAPGGVAGAKAALGLPQIPVDDEATVSESDDGQTPLPNNPEPEAAIPQYDAETAIKALESKRTVKTLDDLYDEICDDFRLTGRELSDEVGGKYTEMREALAEKEKL